MNEEDPIVAEVRAAREAYAEEFNFDLNAICQDLRRRTDEAARAGHKVVTRPPRSPQSRPPSKKAG